MNTNHYQSIVVGGGIAGLTAAAYLAKGGKRVLLLEKNNECGGLINSFCHNGFCFDAGARAVENAGILFPMLAELGIELETVRSGVSIGLGEDVVDIEDMGSLSRYRDMLVKHYPHDAKEIDTLMGIIKRIMKDMDVLYGIENPLFKDLKHDVRYIFTKLLPWLPKFLWTVRRINRQNQPIETYLQTIISNPSLRDIIAQHFFKATPTFFALSYMSLFLDYHYPKGGVGKLADAMVDKITELGGTIKTNTTVNSIDADTKTLTDTQANRYTYDNLIWAADLNTLYAITQTTHEGFALQREKLARSRGSDSVYSIYLEVDLEPSYFGEIANGHFFYTPSTQGLSDTYTTELQALLASWDRVEDETLYDWMERYIELNTFEIAIPTLRDPTLAPKGQTGVVVSFLAEYDLFVKLEDSGLRKVFRERMETKVIEVLTRSIFPKLQSHIFHRFSFSPLGIAQRVGSSQGAITGWSFEHPSPVVNKMQYSDRSVLTPIPSIFQAGQWAYSPAGVPMSILTGKLASTKAMM